MPFVVGAKCFGSTCFLRRLTRPTKQKIRQAETPAATQARAANMPNGNSKSFRVAPHSLEDSSKPDGQLG